jgi:hypothetical protein
MTERRETGAQRRACSKAGSQPAPPMRLHGVAHGRIETTDQTSEKWLRRLYRTAADLNVVLLLFAIGFAALDATFITTQYLVDRLPKINGVT